MLHDVFHALREAPVLLSLAKHLRPRPLTTVDSIGLRVERTAARFPDHTAILFEGRSLNWSQFNELSNRYAHALQAQGVSKGDTVSLFMENRVEYLASVVALAKLGAVTALINTNLNGRSLAHCIAITDSSLCLFGEERLREVDEIRGEETLTSLRYLFVPDLGEAPCPAWAVDFDAQARRESKQNPDSTGTITIGDLALYVFTSGTTGLPKAGVMSHRRFLTIAGSASAGVLRCDQHDCIYLCLPLYHGTALFVGAGSAFNTGAALFIRRKFSASAFLPEVREHGCTCFIYIGEICRYLLATPAADDDYVNPLTTITGNGLRPDIWHAFKSRFGISRVAEFYGASEGNIGFINLFNRDCTVGTTTLPHTVVRYDVDNDTVVRDANGRCIKVENGEPGLLLGKITRNTQFEGYTNSEATESKILRDVYKPGDACFNTGNLLRRVDVGFAFGLPHYQFVDRVGDTFRWKGENVSTNEVGEVLNTHPQVHFCNVYGVQVPGTDGRAGMAALVLEDGAGQLDLDSFSELVQRELPAYARPLFLRLLPAMDTTGTFKMLKGDLRRQGFDPGEVDDPLYVLKPGSNLYEPLDDGFYAAIRDATAGY